MTWNCWLDRASAIVVCNRRAVKLGPVEWTVFTTVHAGRMLRGHRSGRRERQTISAKLLTAKIYNGTTMPPTPIAAIVKQLNRKLERLHLRIRLYNHGREAFYQIERC